MLTTDQALFCSAGEVAANDQAPHVGRGGRSGPRSPTSAGGAPVTKLTQAELEGHLLTAIAKHFWRGRIWKKTAKGPRHFKEPLSFAHLAAHLDGTGLAIGLAPIVPGTDLTRVAVLDFDDHDKTFGWDRMVGVARPVADALRAQGYVPMVFRSSGGHGIHIYLFWGEPVPARSAREMLKACLAGFDLKDGTKGVKHGEVEVYPRQNSVPLGGAGNMVVLPFAGESVLLDPVTLEVRP